MVTDNNFVKDQSMAYFKLTYNSDGETRYSCVVIRGWANRNDNTNWFFAVAVDCPAEQAAEYMALFTKVRNALSDI